MSRRHRSHRSDARANVMNGDRRPASSDDDSESYDEAPRYSHTNSRQGHGSYDNRYGGSSSHQRQQYSTRAVSPIRSTHHYVRRAVEGDPRSEIVYQEARHTAHDPRTGQWNERVLTWDINDVPERLMHRHNTNVHPDYPNHAQPHVYTTTRQLSRDPSHPSGWRADYVQSGPSQSSHHGHGYPQGHAQSHAHGSGHDRGHERGHAAGHRDHYDRYRESQHRDRHQHHDGRRHTYRSAHGRVRVEVHRRDYSSSSESSSDSD